ncbi:hypothetical protein V5N11_018718 [Cardamine amara subsp. amara]|uniref:Uncharacterized protein n=1 Tax=Cardamine amara subsp. amara TaxID=228776 RepID=A0ABD1AZZ0_CARAN
MRMLLDTASNDNFLNQDVDEGWKLVENLAQSDGNYTEEYNRNMRGSVDSDEKTKKDLKALNEKLDILIGQQKHVHFASEEEIFQVQDGEDDQMGEVSDVQNQGSYNKGFINYKNNPNLSYRSTNPQDQVYPQQQQNQNKPFVPYSQTQGFVPKQNFQRSYQQQGVMGTPPGFAPQQAQPSIAPDQDLQTMMQQLLQGQATCTMDTTKKLAELKNHMDYSYNNLNSKIEMLHSKIKFMENNTASTSSTKPIGQLPGKAIQNPKDFAPINAITLRSGIELLAREGSTPITADSEDQEGEGLCQEEKQAEKTNLHLPGQLDTPTRPPSRVQPSPVEKPTAAKEKKAPFVLPPYKPKLPFPGRFKKDILEKYKAIFDKHIKEIEVKMPILDALALLPQSHKWIKDAIVERI